MLWSVSLMLCFLYALVLANWIMKKATPFLPGLFDTVSVTLIFFKGLEAYI